MKITYAQKEKIFRIHAAGGVITAGNTNGTLCALEKKGLVSSDAFGLCCRWSLTSAGVEVVRARDEAREAIKAQIGRSDA